jgi:hypothetical protein
VFKIKDGSTDFFTLSQSTGQVNILKTLRLENTSSSTTGVIYKVVDRFLHNYRAPLTDGANTFLGINAGNFTMSGSGVQASYNTGIGPNALLSLTTGYSNIAIGVDALTNNSTGRDNTAIGNSSLRSNTGNFNTAVGSSSLFNNTTAVYNTAVGYQSLYSTTDGGNNTAVGYQSLYSTTYGSFNTAVGFHSLYYNTAAGNTALGWNSLTFNTTGYSNTAVGYQSLFTNSTGYSNTALGLNSLYSNTGNQNTALGNDAGTLITTGSNLTCLGYNAQPTSNAATNQITLGDANITSLRCNVTTITALSDARDKKNIKDLSLGINFLMKLKPRIYNWDKREWYEDNISDGSKMKEAPTAGFIAQELDEVQTTQNAEWLNLVLKDNPEKLEATPGNLLPVMVKAIQELKAENDLLKVRLAKIEKILNKEKAGK